MSTPTITPITPARAGTDLVAAMTAATVGGDFIANTGKEMLIFNNGAGSGTITVTVTPNWKGASDPDGITVTPPTVAVAFGKTVVVPPFHTFYNDASGNLALTYTGVASFKVGVIAGSQVS